MEWFFYRVSARYPRAVWANARSAWQNEGLSHRAAAEAMDYDPAFVARNADPIADHPSPLTYPRAAALTTALTTPYHPEDFLRGIEHNIQEPRQLTAHDRNR